MEEGDDPQLSSEACLLHSISKCISVDKCRTEFLTLVESVLALLNNTDALEICKEFCSYLRISDESDKLLFDEQKILPCKNFEELFEILHHHLNWDEYSILSQIIEICDSKEAQQELENYERKMALNFGLKLIFDHNRTEPPPGYANFVFILNKPYKELTVEQYKNIRKFIFEHLDVHQYISLPFIHVFFGSVHFHWHVKMDAVPHMIKMALQNKEIFFGNSCVFMEIGSKVVLDKRKQVRNCIADSLECIVSKNMVVQFSPLES